MIGAIIIAQVLDPVRIIVVVAGVLLAYRIKDKPLRWLAIAASCVAGAALVSLFMSRWETFPIGIVSSAIIAALTVGIRAAIVSRKSPG